MEVNKMQMASEQFKHKYEMCNVDKASLYEKLKKSEEENMQLMEQL